MERDDLERWLCGPDVPLMAPGVIATQLGLPTRTLADTTLLRIATRLRSLRLILAVLRDVFADDADVRLWLGARHETLGGRTAVEAILAGRETDVVEVAVASWNEAVRIGRAA